MCVHSTGHWPGGTRRRRGLPADRRGTDSGGRNRGGGILTVTVADRYPTRGAGRIGIEPRHDPVAWAPDRDGPLDRRTVDSFDTNGFLAVDTLLDADVVADLQHELSALRTSE